jgi:hypothetical protein
MGGHNCLLFPNVDMKRNPNISIVDYDLFNDNDVLLTTQLSLFDLDQQKATDGMEERLFCLFRWAQIDLKYI